MSSTFLRPAPVHHPAATPVVRDTPPADAAAALRAGRLLRVRDHFRTGVEVLSALDELIPPPSPGAPYAERRARARSLREAAMRLLVPIRGHAVALDGATPIGFLAELYPDLDAFHLPLVQVQELAGAWKRYQEGVHLAVLGRDLHPFYGTYAPTRTEHLELFGTWLAGYGGLRSRAADVGTGCGVLALMLARAGFARVWATDRNLNAVESVRRELQRDPRPAVDVFEGDLLAPVPGPLDLVVFNPPWTRDQADSLVEAALVQSPDLLPRFFHQALEKLAPDGRVVLLFSNIMQLVQPELPHPIQAELDRGRLRLVQKLRRRIRPPAGSGRRTRERVEVWELAQA